MSTRTLHRSSSQPSLDALIAVSAFNARSVRSRAAKIPPPLPARLSTIRERPVIVRCAPRMAAMPPPWQKMHAPP